VLQDGQTPRHGRNVGEHSGDCQSEKVVVVHLHQLSFVAVADHRWEDKVDGELWTASWGRQVGGISLPKDVRRNHLGVASVFEQASQTSSLTVRKARKGHQRMTQRRSQGTLS
jgi:hypothetical protein